MANSIRKFRDRESEWKIPFPTFGNDNASGNSTSLGGCWHEKLVYKVLFGRHFRAPENRHFWLSSHGWSFCSGYSHWQHVMAEAIKFAAASGGILMPARDSRSLPTPSMHHSHSITFQYTNIQFAIWTNTVCQYASFTHKKQYAAQCSRRYEVDTQVHCFEMPMTVEDSPCCGDVVVCRWNIR